MGERRSITARVVGLAIGLLSFFVATTAHAYCRATTCDPRAGDNCEKNEEGCIRTGAGLRWRSLPIPYRFSAAGTTKLDEESARAAVRKAFDKWASVECNGVKTSLGFVELADSHRDGDDFNIYFRDDAWNHDDSDETLAQTNQRYGKYTGFIDHSDIEINTAQSTFSLGEDTAGPNGIDFESVILHEVGHYIGIAHSNVPGSIMAPRYCQDPSQCGQGELSDDDIAAVCLLYPAARMTDTLAPPPDRANQGCSVAPGANNSSRSAWIGLVIAVITSLTRICGRASSGGSSRARSLSRWWRSPRGRPPKSCASRTP